MLVGENSYFLNFLLVCVIFYLFVLLISVFGFIFFYHIRKINNKDWELNFLESSIISFAIGLSIYISYCFILDIFQFYNFFSGYYSIAIIDALFIWYLIYRGELNREKISNFIYLLKSKFATLSKQTIISIIILIFVFSWQIWVQWSIITREYAILSKDTYVWLGQSWYLLENGYLWREHMPLHYPKGYTFFLVGPELIYPDWRLVYFYMKFAGIPFFSFYLFVIFIILKRVFEKNYMILIGLLLTLMSNFLFSRFNSFVSSSIPTLLILISLIIFISKSPFYLTGFLIPLIFLFNAIFALFYIIAIGFLLILKFTSLERDYKGFFINYIGKTLIIVIILLLSYVIHIIIVQNINFLDLVIAYFIEFGYPGELLTNSDISINSNDFLLQFRYILRDCLPQNAFISTFLDIEKRILSYFLIFTFISLFLPTRKYFKKYYRDLINFGKVSLLIVLVFYAAEIYFKDSSNIFAQSLPWFKWRTVEAFAGPLIILTCFIIEKVIEKAKMLTIYFMNTYNGYKILINNKILLKFVRIENFIIIIFLISSFSTIIAHQRIYSSYYFEKDQIDTIFYIKEHVPYDSNILVSDFDDRQNFFYNLLSTYDVYKWDFEFEKNTFNETLDYIIRKDIKYILLDYTIINSTEKSYFTSYPYFDELYENDYNIVFEVEIDT
jgi:hypothetical protein